MKTKLISDKVKVPRDILQRNDVISPTELGNAYRLALEDNNELRWRGDREGRGQWLVYDGKRWTTKGGLAKSEELMTRILAGIKQDVRLTSNKNLKESLQKWIRSSQSRNNRIHSIQEASHIPYFWKDWTEFDKNSYLLNCLNGTVDLQTGKLHPHDPNDLITKICPSEYITEEVWDKERFGFPLEVWGYFIWSTVGSLSRIDFLQTFLGMGLCGEPGRAKKYLAIQGDAHTGKSTWLGLLNRVLGTIDQGGYVATIDFNSLVKRYNPGAPRSDIARLPGAKFAVCSEVDPDKAIDEQFLKTLTGGDILTVRTLHKEEFEFKPQCILIIVSNDNLKLDSRSNAVWERVLSFPFTSTFREVKKFTKETLNKEYIKLAKG